MAGPDRALPGDAGHGRLRASRADRDGVLDTLKSAYVLGFVVTAAASEVGYAGYGYGYGSEVQETRTEERTTP